MITIRLVAGLGNQMHQYAFGRALSLKRNDTFFLNTDPFYYDANKYELSIFPIEAHIATKKERPWYVRLWKKRRLDTLRYPLMFICKKIDPHYLIENSKHPYIHKGMFDYNSTIIKKVTESNNEDWYLEGFWHSEKYFEQYSDIIRKDFTLKQPLNDPKNLSVIKQMKETTSVSIHIRRTDYITLGYKLCDMSYYLDAIAYMQKHLQNPRFFIFSDDIARCREAFHACPIDQIIDWNTGVNSYKDMILMSQCKHNIIANSTFSRWGARLNENPEKIIIAPAQRHKSIDYADIIPSTWVKL